MSINDINTQTRFMVLFTSRSLLTWGKPFDALSGVSPRYLSTIYSQLTISPFLLQTSYYDGVCLFSQGVDRWRKEMALIWGVSTSAPYCIHFIYPPLPQQSCPPSPALRLGERGREFTTTLPSC